MWYIHSPGILCHHAQKTITMDFTFAQSLQISNLKIRHVKFLRFGKTKRPHELVSGVSEDVWKELEVRIYFIQSRSPEKKNLSTP